MNNTRQGHMHHTAWMQCPSTGEEPCLHKHKTIFFIKKKNQEEKRAQQNNDDNHHGWIKMSIKPTIGIIVAIRRSTTIIGQYDTEKQGSNTDIHRVIHDNQIKTFAIWNWFIGAEGIFTISEEQSGEVAEERGGSEGELGLRNSIGFR